MKKEFLLSLIPLVTLISCSVPIAPDQPENGVVYNYKVNTKGRFTNLRRNTLGISQNVNDGTVTINNIPFFKQGKDNTCAQATMTSVLNFWGIKIDYQTVINETNPGNLPTDLEVISNYFEKKGLSSNAFKKANTDYLKSLVNQGRPPIVLLDFGSLKYEHYVVVSGYNDRTKVFLINDPVNGANIPIAYSKFEELWQNKSLRNLLIFGDKYEMPVIDSGKLD